MAKLKREYELFEACKFNEYDYSLMFANMDVLKILHRHNILSAAPDSLDIPEILRLYKQALEEAYRDSRL